MKKLAAAVMTAMTMAVLPAAVAPAARADICAGAHGRHFGVGGCTPGLAGDAIAGAIVASDHAYWPGQQPCYTAEGVPYYTPDGDPC